MAQRLTWKQEFASLILDDAQKEQAMALKIRHFPRRLYRYGRFDDRGHWQAPLLKHTLWLSSPRYFNDPYDCELLMDDAIVDSPAFRKTVGRALRSLHGDRFIAAQEQSLGEAPDIAAWLDDYFAYQDQDPISAAQWREAAYRAYRQATVEGIKVLCFSERVDSALMWGKGCPLYPHIWPVIYQQQRVDFGALVRQGKLSSPTNAALFKAPAWRYEREWRLIWSDIFSRFGDSVRDGGCLRAIYLGAQADERSSPVQRVKRYAQRHGVPLYRMQTSTHDYRLQAVQLE